MLHLVPTGPRHAKVVEATIHLNYTTILNVVFLILAAALLLRFFTTGGRKMLTMMDEPMDEAGT